MNEDSKKFEILKGQLSTYIEKINARTTEIKHHFNRLDSATGPKDVKLRLLYIKHTAECLELYSKKAEETTAKIFKLNKF